MKHLLCAQKTKILASASDPFWPRWSQSWSVILPGLFLALLAVTISQPSSTYLVRTPTACRMVPLQMELRSRHCIPKTIEVSGCRGACHSYARADSNSDGLEHSCECCSEIGRVVETVRLSCPTVEFPTRWTNINISIPTGCACRPCS